MEKETNERLDNLESRIEELKQEILKLQTICSRMNGHITFVEDTYEKLKFPLNVVKSKVESLFGSQKKELE
jgi:predicted nuclease with TOPRIM domain